MRAIRDHVAARGYSPTFRELQKLTGIASTSTVEYWLHRLRADGYITYTDDIARTARLTTEGEALVA